MVLFELLSRPSHVFIIVVLIMVKTVMMRQLSIVMRFVLDFYFFVPIFLYDQIMVLFEPLSRLSHVFIIIVVVVIMVKTVMMMLLSICVYW